MFSSTVRSIFRSLWAAFWSSWIRVSSARWSVIREASSWIVAGGVGAFDCGIEGWDWVVFAAAGGVFSAVGGDGIAFCAGAACMGVDAEDDGSGMRTSHLRAGPSGCWNSSDATSTFCGDLRRGLAPSEDGGTASPPDAQQKLTVVALPAGPSRYCRTNT